jgi:O-antigen/teichoic acid export membrane protein
VRREEAAATTFVRFWSFATSRGLATVFQVTVLWLDILLLGALRTTREAAIYAGVSRYLLVGLMGLTAITMVIAPRLSGLLTLGRRRDAEATFQAATAWTILMSWPIYLMLAVFSPVLLRVFGEGFAEGHAALTIVSLAMLVNTGTGPVNAALLMAGRNWWVVANTLGSLGLNISLNLVLIPHLGVTGAAIAWAASIVFENLMPLLQVALFMRLRPFGPAVWSGAIGSASIYGGIALLCRLTWGPSIGAFVAAGVSGTIVYLIFLWLIRRRMLLHVVWEALRRGRSGRVAAAEEVPDAP